jgi:hypothetical protein
MKISQLIEELKAIKECRGDLPVGLVVESGYGRYADLSNVEAREIVQDGDTDSEKTGLFVMFEWSIKDDGLWRDKILDSESK